MGSANPLQPENAYKEALSGTEVSLGDFALWLRAADSGELGDPGMSARTMGHLKKVISGILPGFSDPCVSETGSARLLVKKKGIYFDLEQLSDGERGLLALAFDLTRRLTILNPHLKDPAAESEAVVMLDEIELHLHPLWQREVMRRLLKTFKQSQFIVTTHSPQVLGEVNGSSIRFLTRERGKMYCWTPDRSLGFDSNRVLEELMGAPSRNTRIGSRSHRLFKLIDDGKFKAASNLLAQIEKELGEKDGDVIRARALMAFVRGK